MDAGDRVYDSMQEGNHIVGELPRHHLPLGNSTVGGAGSRSSNSTVKAVFIDALDTVTNASAPAQEPRQKPAICPTLIVPEDYTPNGEGPRTGQPESHLVRSPRSLEKPQKERVLILAANSGGSCSLRLGDYYNFLSLLDKLQYGNVHGYDVLLGLGNVDDDLRKTWNKVAWMQKVCCAFAVLHSVPILSTALHTLMHMHRVRQIVYGFCVNHRQTLQVRVEMRMPYLIHSHAQNASQEDVQTCWSLLTLWNACFCLSMHRAIRETGIDCMQA